MSHARTAGKVIGVFTPSGREERTMARMIFDGVTSKSGSSASDCSTKLSGGERKKEKANQFCDRLQDLAMMMLI
jgi:hypothetical protein